MFQPGRGRPSLHWKETGGLGRREPLEKWWRRTVGATPLVVLRMRMERSRCLVVSDGACSQDTRSVVMYLAGSRRAETSKISEWSRCRSGALSQRSMKAKGERSHDTRTNLHDQHDPYPSGTLPPWWPIRIETLKMIIRLMTIRSPELCLGHQSVLFIRGSERGWDEVDGEGCQLLFADRIRSHLYLQG